MEYQIFEEEKTLKIMSKRVENGKMRDDFDEIRKRLGLNTDHQLYSACAAIGFYIHYHNNVEKLPELPDPTKLVDLSALEDREMFDYLVLKYLDKEENRLETFQNVFFLGFKTVRDWFHDREPDTEPQIELDKFRSLYEYVEKICESE